MFEFPPFCEWKFQFNCPNRVINEGIYRFNRAAQTLLKIDDDLRGNQHHNKTLKTTKKNTLFLRIEWRGISTWDTNTEQTLPFKDHLHYISTSHYVFRNSWQITWNCKINLKQNQQLKIINFGSLINAQLNQRTFPSYKKGMSRKCTEIKRTEVLKQLQKSFYTRYSFNDAVSKN